MTATLTQTPACGLMLAAMHLPEPLWGLPFDESFFRFQDTKQSPLNGTAEESGKQEVLVVASRMVNRGLIPVRDARHALGRVFVRPA